MSECTHWFGPWVTMIIPVEIEDNGPRGYAVTVTRKRVERRYCHQCGRQQTREVRRPRPKVRA